MTPSPSFPPRVREIIRELSGDERSISIAVGSIIHEADASGSARFNDVVIRYRDDYLRALRTEGKDAEREAGRLGLDEVRSYIATSIVPRLIGDGALVGPPPDSEDPDARLQLSEKLWRDVGPNKLEVAEGFLHAGEEASTDPLREMRPAPKGSILEA